MQVTLYKFSKRVNSTKQPMPSDGKIFTCQLKDETSFLNPVLRFAPNTLTTGLFSPSAFNYASIPYWQRFYYITDWPYINGEWEATLSVDVLASFKGEIGNTSAYIIRSASRYNGDILDSFYPASTSCGIVKQQFAQQFIYHTYIANGSFILGVINSLNNAQFGAITYYALTLSQLSDMLQYLFSANIYNNSSITEIGRGLYQSMFNPFQYIVSCMWVPWSPSNIGSTTANIKVGYWDTGVSGIIASTLVKEFGYFSAQPLDLHPQWQSRGFYLNKEPYSRYTVFIPPFGQIPIDTAYIAHEYEMTGHEHNFLHGSFYCDCITGIADLYLSITDGYGTLADPNKYFTMRSAQVGVPVQLAQVMTDYMSTVGNGLGAIASGFTGNIGGIFSNIASAVESAMPKVSISGSNGCITETIIPPFIVCEHYYVAEENNAEFGRPLCDTKTISQLSGFIKCGEDDHSFSATQSESEQINRYMSDGFFYE